jgi:zinc protease
VNVLFFLAVAISMASTSSSASTQRSRLPELRLPIPHETVLDNGLRLIVAERGPIPMVTVRLVLRAGSAMDPPGKEGLAEFTARLLRRGTRTLNASQLEDAIENVGGSFGVDASVPDYLSLTVSSPSEHLAKMFEVLALMVREPTFPATELAMAKRRTVGAIANIVDSPGDLVNRAALWATYGKHPYGHEPIGTTSAVEGFTREDVLRFYSEKMGPKVALLVVTGKVDADQVRAQATSAFAGWKGGPSEAVDPPPPETFPNGKIVLVDKPEQTQSQIAVMGPGLRKGAPELQVARILESALSDGFTSRLVEEIRVNRGLSYSIGAVFDRFKNAGTFEVATYTQTETTRAMIDAILEEIGDVREKGLKPAELDRVKHYLSSMFPMRLETADAYGASLAEIRLYNLGEDYLRLYRERMWDVTMKDVKSVAGKYLFATRPLIVIVGNAAAVAPQLKGLGTVERLSVDQLK